MTLSTTDCTLALRSVLEKRFGSFTGFPPNCRVDDALPLVAQGTGDEAAFWQRDSTGSLGEGQGKVSFRMGLVSGYAHPIRLWHDDGRLLLFEAELPEIAGGWPALYKVLGEPDAQLDYAWDVLTVKAGEWIYAARGLAVFLTPAADRLTKLTAFTPTTVADYRLRLRRQSQVEEFPRR